MASHSPILGTRDPSIEFPCLKFLEWFLFSCLDPDRYKVYLLKITSVKQVEEAKPVTWEISLNNAEGEKVKVLATQSRPPLCNLTDCSPPGPSVHGILQARTLEWVAIQLPGGSSWPRDGTRIASLVVRSFTIWATREALGEGSERPVNWAILSE